jgi:hypothetical protein
MKFDDFKDLKFLNINTVTVWGEPAFADYEGLNKAFVKKVDLYIGYMINNGAGTFKIHDFNTRTHDGKDHPGGVAVDIDFTGIPLGDQVFMSLIFGWSKLGFYPEWHSPGLHLSYVVMNPPLVWKGYYVTVDGKQSQKYMYSSMVPVDVTREVFRNGGM